MIALVYANSVVKGELCLLIASNDSSINTSTIE